MIKDKRWEEKKMINNTQGRKKKTKENKMGI